MSEKIVLLPFERSPRSNRTLASQKIANQTGPASQSKPCIPEIGIQTSPAPQSEPLVKEKSNSNERCCTIRAMCHRKLALKSFVTQSEPNVRECCHSGEPCFKSELRVAGQFSSGQIFFSAPSLPICRNELHAMEVLTKRNAVVGFDPRCVELFVF